ncbi:MAG: hypothetical protein NTV22_02425 [bacterium]|nr:hypothetical protein [bacterium]
MQTLSLNGAWQVRQPGKPNTYAARVPGCVHEDLLRAGAITDPYYRDHEVQQQWIGEADWEYSRTFDVPAPLLACARVLLECAGLDTFATITINGQPVASTDNMFRTWRFDVKKNLRAGRNTIAVRFASVLPYMRQREQQRAMKGVHNVAHEPAGRCYVRKMQCNFGWDWGPVLVTCGIFRDLRVVAYDVARIADVLVQQEHAHGAVTLAVRATLATVGRAAGLQARVCVQQGRRLVAESSVPVVRGVAHARLQIADPALWWPRGLGAQPLYTVTVTLHDAPGAALDAWSRKIGVRTLRLRRATDQWGESFGFEANGVPFFAKGANWIPADAMYTRVTREHYRMLLRGAVDANMNMLRVWGGGYYEADAFYELCDELGLCVWQDCMFACSNYPYDDCAFVDNVRAELADNVRRLRHHACLALWCGNNELEFDWFGLSKDEWAHYRRFFDKQGPRVIAAQDPQRDYWPGSPHTPGAHRDQPDHPTHGDAHLWTVWHGRQPFEWYRTTTHRFVSEFGFQSFPEPATVAAFTAPGDRAVNSRIMDLHQRSPIGNVAIMHYMLDWFAMPLGFENTVWLSQIQQGLAIKYAVEHWRRLMPRCMGALYWQHNDCWPAASWASLDFHGRWKALHYLARKFFAPVLVSGVENAADGTVAVHVSNDLRKDLRATLAWRVTSTAGAALDDGRMPVTVPAGTASQVTILNLKHLVDTHGSDALLVWLYVRKGPAVLSANLVHFERPRHLRLSDPHVTAVAKQVGPQTFDVTIRARRPALWVWLDAHDLALCCTDNFFSMPAHGVLRVRVTVATPVRLAEFRRHLRVRSLWDTFEHAPVR